MASLTIRKLDEATKSKLRVRAAHNNRSMEDEARCILRDALAEDSSNTHKLVHSITQRFQALGGLDLELPGRTPMRPPPKPGSR